MRTALAAVAAALLLTGCGSAPASESGCSREEGWRVAGDPNASPAKVVACGVIGYVAVSGDRRLVTFRVHPEDDELPGQGAWRLYDAQGRTVAEAGLGEPAAEGPSIEVRTLPEGFLIARGEQLSRLDRAGEEHPVSVSPKAAPIPRGAVLLGGDSRGAPSTTWFDPATGTAAKVPQPPFQAQLMAYDDQGVLWAVKTWGQDKVELASSVGGSGPWRPGTIPVHQGSSVGGFWAEDGRLLLTTSRMEGNDDVLDGLYTHPAGTPDAPWTAHPVTGITGRTLDARAHSIDGTLVVEAPYAGIFTLAGERFTTVALPEETRREDIVDAGALRITDAGVYWAQYSSDRLWRTDALGGSWQEVPR